MSIRMEPVPGYARDVTRLRWIIFQGPLWTLPMPTVPVAIRTIPQQVPSVLAPAVDVQVVMVSRPSPQPQRPADILPMMRRRPRMPVTLPAAAATTDMPVSSAISATITIAPILSPTFLSPKQVSKPVPPQRTHHPIAQMCTATATAMAALKPARVQSPGAVIKKAR